MALHEDTLREARAAQHLAWSRTESRCRMKGSVLTAEVVEALVAALLAVNQYPVDKAWAIIPRHRASRS